MPCACTCVLFCCILQAVGQVLRSTPSINHRVRFGCMYRMYRRNRHVPGDDGPSGAVVSPGQSG